MMKCHVKTKILFLCLSFLMFICGCESLVFDVVDYPLTMESWFNATNTNVYVTVNIPTNIPVVCIYTNNVFVYGLTDNSPTNSLMIKIDGNNVSTRKLNKFGYVDKDNNVFIDGTEYVSITVNDNIVYGRKTKHGNHLQINMNDSRKELVKRVGLFCVAYGGSTLYNTESHATKHMSLIKKCLSEKPLSENTLLLNNTKTTSLKENGEPYKLTKNDFMELFNKAIDNLNTNKYDLLVIDIMCHGTSYYNVSNGKTNDVNGAYNTIMLNNGVSVYDYEFWPVLKKANRGRVWLLLNNCKGGTSWYNSVPRVNQHDYDPNRNSDIYMGNDINLMVWTAAPDDTEAWYSNMNYASVMLSTIDTYLVKSKYNCTYSELWEYVKKNTYSNTTTFKNAAVQMFKYGEWNDIFDKEKVYR